MDGKTITIVPAKLEQRKTTREDLFKCFTEGLRVEINGVEGVIDSLQREDGSGFSFNVTLSHGCRQVIIDGVEVKRESVKTVVYLRCSD